MQALKFVAALSSPSIAASFADKAEGHLLSSPLSDTHHLPFAALFVGVTDDLEAISEIADIGLYLVCERTIKNQPLTMLSTSELPGSVGIFTMVANERMGALASDQHWRDQHAPLALEVHTAMTHYYQLSATHRFKGPEWNGFALCCFASEDDLRHRFFNSKEGQRRINEDVSRFADTEKSPRRVIAKIIQI
jgi:hypothetical protein